MALSKIRSLFTGGPQVRFLCLPEWVGVIEPPQPARKSIPEWFKSMPKKRRTQIDEQTSYPVPTAKACHGLFEGMAAGWIFKTIADVDVTVWDNQRKAKWATRYDVDDIITVHSKSQTEGMPNGDKVVAKWTSYWQMRTAKGWSTLFVPPLNGGNEFFEVFPAAIRTDIYKGDVLFPFTFKQDGEFYIPAGTPIAQAIPFKRFEPKAIYSAMTKGEIGEKKREVTKIYLKSGHYKKLCTEVDKKRKNKP